MKTCDACQAIISDSFSRCPLCGIEHTADRTNALYPITKKQRKGSLYRISVCALWIGCLASVICNLCVGGVPWCLYVLSGAFVCYTAFLSPRLVDTGFIQPMTSTGISISILLFVVERVTDSGRWATHIVIPCLLFGVLLSGSVIYLFWFDTQRNHFAAPLQIITCAICAMLFALLGFMEIHWPIIVLSAYSLAVVIVTAILYRKPFAAEFKKKLHR